MSELNARPAKFAILPIPSKVLPEPLSASEGRASPYKHERMNRL